MCKKFSFFCTLVLLSRLSSNDLNFDMYFFMIKWQVLVCNYSISECTKILNWMIEFILCRYKNEFGRWGPFSWLGATYKFFYYDVCMKWFFLYKFLSFVSFGIELNDMRFLIILIFEVVIYILWRSISCIEFFGSIEGDLVWKCFIFIEIELIFSRLGT